MHVFCRCWSRCTTLSLYQPGLVGRQHPLLQLTQKTWHPRQRRSPIWVCMHGSSPPWLRRLCLILSAHWQCCCTVATNGYTCLACFICSCYMPVLSLYCGDAVTNPSTGLTFHPNTASTSIDSCTPSTLCETNPNVQSIVGQGVVIFNPNGLLGNGSFSTGADCTGATVSLIICDHHCSRSHTVYCRSLHACHVRQHLQHCIGHTGLSNLAPVRLLQ